MAKTTVRIDRETLRRLGKFGSFHSTYESIIIKLIDHVENCKESNFGRE